ncbi:MAG: nitrous oxide reductase accessory protein NosL [Flavobacteriaceae bacterium]|nr:nitrous oxide reductase accessory protein NosL [Psychroflexus sp.]
MKNIFALLMILVLSGCSKEKKPIAYGNDACDFCRMTIVDKIHAAEIVTDKAKVYKFDAVECMINYKNDMAKEKVDMFFTNHYQKPEELIRAEQATFLISEGIPSPMGEFITAFQTKDAAEDVLTSEGGKLYTWDELLKQQASK